MLTRWVLVDGYSVLHAWPQLRKLGGRALEQRRDALLRVLRHYADHSGRKVTVVFDGYAAKYKPQATEPGHGVDVLFSEQGKTADDTIERLVAQAEQQNAILVVTSDSGERQTVESMGARSLSAEVFEAEVEDSLAELARLVREHSRRRRLGSVLPLLIGLLWLFSTAHAVLAAGKAEHVVVVVWDGLRPDTISADLTPTLYKLAKDGVFFQNHHAVYLSSTEVNGTALATGLYPARNGTLANREYRPAIDPLKPVATESPAAVQTMCARPLATILQQASRRTAVVGAKKVTRIHDPHPRADTPHACVNLFDDQGLPEAAAERITKQLGRPGPSGTSRDDWATRALTGPLWDGGVPAFSVLWLSQPDFAQHQHGVGSELSRAAQKNSDQNLARVLSELEAKGIGDKTDVFVVSDHGFSTIARGVDVVEVLKKAEFRATRAFTQPPAPGDVLVVGNGGSTLLYVAGHDEPTVRRLVEFLQQQEFLGVIFCREPIDGTFTLDQARLNTPTAPDIVLSLRWTEDKNRAGIAGMIVTDGGMQGAGQGAHGSLSRFDMRATLVAAGPDFRRGLIDELPSGNADIAPTVLHILGVAAPQPLDGRVLAEALIEPPPKFAPVELQTLEAVRDVGNWRWHQYLKVTTFAGAFYLDEGNGGYTAK